MPELPEVETIRRQLAPLLEGRALTKIEVLDERWSRPLPPVNLARTLQGREVLALERRGKYLVWKLSGGLYLAQHLRMTGTLLWDPQHEPPHTRVRIELDGEDPHRLLIVDPRRFGTGELLAGPEELELFFAARLGLEPLEEDFTATHLRDLARGRRAPIKAFLLDQRRVAGVGNIYADEALWAARIHPLRPAGKLTLAQWEALACAVRDALLAGIDARGASIDDFHHVDGVRGTFQDRFQVHRRAGSPCPRCATEIIKIRAAGRGTYLCPTCQPAPRRVRL